MTMISAIVLATSAFADDACPVGMQCFPQAWINAAVDCDGICDDASGELVCDVNNGTGEWAWVRAVSDFDLYASGTFSIFGGIDGSTPAFACFFDNPSVTSAFIHVLDPVSGLVSTDTRLNTVDDNNFVRQWENLEVTVIGSDNVDVIEGSDALVFEKFEGHLGTDTLRYADHMECDGSSDTITCNSSDAYCEVFGGDGNDTITCSTSKPCGVHGDAGNDTVYGSGEADTIWGGLGLDTVWAGAGNDVVYGGNGSDTLWGEDGDDDMYGELGVDWLYGGFGIDELRGGFTSPLVIDASIDYLWGDQDGDLLFGDDGSDQIRGGYGQDYIHGGNGDDKVNSGPDDDDMFGNAGTDTLCDGDVVATATKDRDVDGGTGADTGWVNKHAGHTVVWSGIETCGDKSYSVAGGLTCILTLRANAFCISDN